MNMDEELAKRRKDAGLSNFEAGPFDELALVLMDAFDQAASGKGQERHGGNKPFTEQPIFLIEQLVGPGFNAGQAIKKTQEALRMAAQGEPGKARHELLGAIVYLASIAHLFGQQDALRKSAARHDLYPNKPQHLDRTMHVQV